MPRIELLMLFLRSDRDSEGKPRVFVRSNEVEEGKWGIDSSAGNDGEWTMDGAFDPVRAELFAIPSDDAVGCS